MIPVSCPTPTQELLAYWLGELDAQRELALEEHLFACAACSESLRAMVELGAAIRRETLRGGFGFVASEGLIQRMKEAGLKMREYDVEPGGSVSCTITPEDDFVVSNLHASLTDVRRLDVIIDDPGSGTHRAADVAFDPEADHLTFVPSAAYLRTLGHVQQRMRLVAVDGDDERVIGDYTFNHSPS
jgi:hypothetical protein